MAEHTKGKKDGTPTPADDATLAETRRLDRGTTAPEYQREIVNWPDSLSGGALDVTLHGTPTDPTDIQGFWEFLRQRTEAITFSEYYAFIEKVLCKGEGEVSLSLKGAI